MRCAQFEDRLQQLLDQRESPSEDSQLIRHARHCAKCSETLAACERMIDGLNLLELPVPDDRFAWRVVDQTRVSVKPSAATHRHRTAAAAAVAAGLMLAVALSFFGQGDRMQTASAPVSTADTPEFAGASRTNGLTADAPLGDAENPRRGAGGRPFPPVGLGPQPPRTAASNPPTDTASSPRLDQQPPLALLRSWTASWSDLTWAPMDGLAGGLTPITTPLGVAVQEIRRTIPLGRADRPAASSTDSV